MASQNVQATLKQLQNESADAEWAATCSTYRLQQAQKELDARKREHTEAVHRANHASCNAYAYALSLLGVD